MDALKAVMELARVGNQYFNDKEPWKNKEDSNAIYISASIARSLSNCSSRHSCQALPSKFGSNSALKAMFQDKSWASASELMQPGTEVKEPKTAD